MAVAKLSEAERAKEEMESELKRKEQELQKRTGARFRLAGGEDAVKVCVSHRGLGAFPRADMSWRRKADEVPTSQPDQQVPVEDDPVAAASSTTPADVDADAASLSCQPDVAAEAATSQPDQQVPVEDDPVAAASSTTHADVDASLSCPDQNTPPDVAAEAATSQPDHQVPVEDDPVAAASSTTPADVDAEATSAADGVEQSDEQTHGESNYDDAVQQLHPATSSLAPNNNEQLLTAST